VQHSKRSVPPQIVLQGSKEGGNATHHPIYLLHIYEVRTNLTIVAHAVNKFAAIYGTRNVFCLHNISSGIPPKIAEFSPRTLRFCNINSNTIISSTTYLPHYLSTLEYIIVRIYLNMIILGTPSSHCPITVCSTVYEFYNEKGKGQQRNYFSFCMS
jgi:hypothetical protein